MLVLEGLRGETVALVVGLLLACVASVVAFGRQTLVLDRRRGRVETVWGAPLPCACFLAGRGPFAGVVLTRVEDVYERDETTRRETTYPVALRGSGGATPLRAFSAWEDGRDFAEVVARFLGVGFEDEVHEVTLAPDRLDEPLARDTDKRPSGSRRPKPFAGARWNGEDELVVEVPRPGRPMVQRFLGFGMIALFWMPFPLCAGAVIEALLPIVVVVAAGLKLAWGYGASVTANANGLTVVSRGLLLRRRTHIPLAELESLLLLKPEWGGARGLLAEFFECLLVARSDRAAVRFGHGLARGELLAIQRELVQLFVRLGSTRELVPPRPDAPAVPGSLAPVAAAGLVGGLAGALLGPPASFCLNLPVLSVVLNALGLSAALVAWWLTRRSPPADRGTAAGGLALIALALGLWLGLDAFPGWITTTPDRDVAAFRAAVENAPAPALREVWLRGLSGPQAVTFFLGVVAAALAAVFVLGVGLVPLGAALVGRWRKRPPSLLPLSPPGGGPPPVPPLPPVVWRRSRAPVVLGALALLWSAADFPGVWAPLTRARQERRERAALEETRRARERVEKERTSRALVRLEMPPPGTLSRGRPALWYFTDYLGADAAYVEHLLWLRQAYLAAGLHVVGFPADVHGSELAALLDERRWHGEHAADPGEAQAYRAWAGFARPGAYALLLNADGSVRDRLALPWEAEARLAAWLGPPALPRPARTAVEIDLRPTYAGHLADLPAEGSMTVLASDAWNFSNRFWFQRRGRLPREALPLTVESGLWRVRVQVREQSGDRWTDAFDGHALVPLPASEPRRRPVEVPLELPLRLLTPEPGAAGYPERPSYPVSAPPVLSWTEAPEADRYAVVVRALDAAESGEPRREILTARRFTLAALPPGSYEITIEARRGELRLGFLEATQGGSWRPGFRFELTR